MCHFQDRPVNPPPQALLQALRHLAGWLGREKTPRVTLDAT